MDGLSDRRTRVWLAGLNRDADEVRSVVTDLCEDFVRLAALVPVHVIQRQRANMIGCGVIAAVTDLGVQVFDFGHAEDAVLDLADQFVFFVDGQIATCTNIDHAERHFDIRKVFDSAPERKEGRVHSQQ